MITQIYRYTGKGRLGVEVQGMLTESGRRGVADAAQECMETVASGLRDCGIRVRVKREFKLDSLISMPAATAKLRRGGGGGGGGGGIVRDFGGDGSRGTRMGGGGGGGDHGGDGGDFRVVDAVARAHGGEVLAELRAYVCVRTHMIYIHI